MFGKQIAVHNFLLWVNASFVRYLIANKTVFSFVTSSSEIAFKQRKEAGNLQRNPGILGF